MAAVVNVADSGTNKVDDDGQNGATAPQAAVGGSGVQATKEQCRFCFDTLLAKLNGEPLPEATFPERDAKAPLFVTWKRRSEFGGEYNLRGCIGNFSDLVLGSGLREYALTSAINDDRFPPIRKHEVGVLSVSVSLLVAFEQASDAFDWEVGKHGIRITFSDPASGTTRSGTFLPEVMEEQGWDKEQALKALVRKAGFRGAVTDAVLATVSLVRYQSSKCTMEFDEFLEDRRVAAAAKAKAGPSK